MIDVKQLESIFNSCLIQVEESSDNTDIIEGITEHFGFCLDRLEANREQIKDWLSQLPHEFRESEGGGWSFLQACMTSEGEQWTGEHRNVDRLLCLGKGLGLVKCLLPREMWGMLPGGMPYYSINIDN